MEEKMKKISEYLLGLAGVEEESGFANQYFPGSEYALEKMDAAAANAEDDQQHPQNQQQ